METNLENNATPNEENGLDTTSMYIDQINNLKQNTVSRTQYDKLMLENKQLLESLVNGSGASSAEEEPPKPTADELRKDLFSGKEMTNLDYCTKALALRQAVLEEEGKDIFVGEGRNLTPTSEAYASAQRVAEVMAECVQAADGSPEIFTAELMRRTNDVKLPLRK